MLAYIDAGTAAAIAAMATGGLAGAKVAAQSLVYGRFGKKKNATTEEIETTDTVIAEPSDNLANNLSTNQQAA